MAGQSFTLDAIGAATFGAIIVYHLLRERGSTTLPADAQPSVRP
jgi:hypothetical protein